MELSSGIDWKIAGLVARSTLALVKDKFARLGQQVLEGGYLSVIDCFCCGSRRPRTCDDCGLWNSLGVGQCWSLGSDEGERCQSKTPHNVLFLIMKGFFS